MSDEFDHASFPVINLLHGQEACESRLELRYSRRDLQFLASLVSRRLPPQQFTAETLLSHVVVC